MTAQQVKKLHDHIEGGKMWIVTLEVIALCAVVYVVLKFGLGALFE